MRGLSVAPQGRHGMRERHVKVLVERLPAVGVFRAGPARQVVQAQPDNLPVAGVWQSALRW